MSKKTFYTERDIQDLADRGVTTLEVNDDVVVTDLARERALALGLRLARASAAHPADDPQAELIHRVKAAVLARLDGQVEATLLDAIVTKIVQSISE
jgi:hypothetical protein